MKPIKSLVDKYNSYHHLPSRTVQILDVTRAQKIFTSL